MSGPETTYFVGNSRAITNAHAARDAANSIGYLLPHLDALAAHTPAFTLLDVGCGPGSITLDLARRYASARITGVDGSATAIAQAVDAQRTAGPHASRCTFAVADALHLPRAGYADFDVVLAHQVLQHVADPLAALASMKAAARAAGGVVTARTMDWGLTAWHPANDGLAVQQTLYIALMRAMGQDALLGRRVHALAARAGWDRHQIETGVDGDWCYDTPAKRAAAAALMCARYTDEGEFARRLRQTGVAADRGVEASLSAIREGYQTWAVHEDGWMVMACPWVLCYNGRSA
jgi:2-polyprenyl-3-methyl-5-hydroxy-6-metoxy-1,4-benzoquinol methylase